MAQHLSATPNSTAPVFRTQHPSGDYFATDGCVLQLEICACLTLNSAHPPPVSCCVLRKHSARMGAIG